MIDIDRELQKNLPIVMMPKYSELDALKDNEKRLILGSNGIFIESKCKAIHCRLKIAPALDIPVPCGYVAKFLKVKQLEEWVKELIVKQSKLALPNEYCLLIVFDADKSEYQIVEPEVISCSPSEVKYKMPELEKNQHIFIDYHTHGLGNAYFSATDNADDKTLGGTYFSVVAGKCDRNPEFKTRLNIDGFNQDTINLW